MKALAVAEASLRRTHPTRHDVSECDGCAVIAIIDALRAEVAELKTREQTQYRITPHEEPCEATWNRPWH